MLRDSVRNTGVVTVEFVDNGVVCRRLCLGNKVVAGGLNRIAAAANNEAVNAVAQMGIGNNGTAAQASDTALYGQIARVGLSASPSRSGASTTYTASFPAGVATGTIAELGLFDSAGTMLARVAFPSQSKESYASVNVTWAITQS